LGFILLKILILGNIIEKYGKKVEKNEKIFQKKKEIKKFCRMIYIGGKRYEKIINYNFDVYYRYN